MKHEGISNKAEYASDSMFAYSLLSVLRQLLSVRGVSTIVSMYVYFFITRYVVVCLSGN